MRFVRKYPPLVLVAGFVIVFLLIVSAAADLVAPYHYTTQDLENRLLPPMFLEGGLPQYLLGTDELGRDILSRLMQGTQVILLKTRLPNNAGVLPGQWAVAAVKAGGTRGGNQGLRVGVQRHRNV